MTRQLTLRQVEMALHSSRSNHSAQPFEGTVFGMENSAGKSMRQVFLAEGIDSSRSLFVDLHEEPWGRVRAAILKPPGGPQLRSDTAEGWPPRRGPPHERGWPPPFYGVGGKGQSRVRESREGEDPYSSERRFPCSELSPFSSSRDSIKDRKLHPVMFKLLFFY